MYFPGIDIMIIVASFHACGQYSSWVHPLKIRAMTFLPLCFSALLVIPSSPGVFISGSLQILFHIMFIRGQSIWCDGRVYGLLAFFRLFNQLDLGLSKREF